MAAAGQYRIGPSDFFLPGDLAADARALRDQIIAFDDAMDGNMQSPTDWFDAWNVWMTRAKHFINATFGGFFDNLAAAFNDSNRDELVSLEQQFETWVQQGAQYGIRLQDGSRVEPRVSSGDSLDNHLKGLGLPSLNTLALIATVIGGAIVLWRLK